MEFPEEALARELKREGLCSIWFKKRVNLTYVANLIALSGYGISRNLNRGSTFDEYRGIRVLSGRGNEEGYVLKRGGELVPELYPDFTPRVVVDLSHVDLLKVSERKSLGRQLFFARWYWNHLYWSSSLVYAGGRKLERILEKTNAVMLDPYGDRELRWFSWRKTYVVGGIVDKGNRLKGISGEIAEEYDLPRYRISLRGKLLGVPYTVDKIVVLIGLLMRGIRVEDAIAIAGAKRWLKKRIESEIKSKNPDLDLVYYLEAWLRRNGEEIIRRFPSIGYREILEAEMEAVRRGINKEI